MSTAVVLEIPKPTKAEKSHEERKHRGIYEKPRGSGRWWIRYADATGRIRRERAPSKSAAIALYQKRKTEVLQGRKLPETMRQAAITFKEIGEYAIEDIKHRYRRPSDDVARLRTAIDWFGGREAGTLTPGEIEAMLSAVATEQGWAASTINHYRSVMSLAYRIAKRDGKVETNPVRDVAHRHENNDRVRSLSTDEERKLRAVIRRSYPVHEDEFDFALNTGLRQGSQFQLTWEMVDFTAREMRISRTKNGRKLTLPLNDTAVSILRRLHVHSRGTGRVFLSEETGKPLNYPKHWFTIAVRQAQIADFHWHDLRHCFATRLRQEGVPLEDIADLLGHKGLAMAKRYAHTDMGRLRQAVGRLARKPTDTTTDTSASHDFANAK